MTSFKAAAGIRNPHLQTILPRVIRRKALFTPHNERLNLPDGDFVDLAWSADPASEQAQNKPVFVLFHGLEGSFNSPYANGLMNAFAKQGWLSVMMHFRGCSGETNLKPRAYHSGEIEDARYFLTQLEQRFPRQKKVAVGISLGGNMLVNYLAHYHLNPILDAATIVSAPLSLDSCAKRIEQGFSKVYRNYLLSSLKRNALNKLPLIQQVLPIEPEQIEQLKRLEEFDDLITSQLHGFDNAQHYYQQCSGIRCLDQISIPTRIIHSKDDPFMTEDVIPNFPLPEHIKYHLLDHGGHVGFLTGSLIKPRFWLEETLPEYYEVLKRSAKSEVLKARY
ncbi:hydrolase [Vibrio tapetis subsp. quintayensis]|uniref:hydrolase n=1 Tax=Vibrio tapetis TaxID=52443 RepID=UPI0025B44961|nr:hydrolase [Vibrio tapetis]MDN3679396.1 hydrolase [Vibrio tapetis subsp. quintayensis]